MKRISLLVVCLLIISMFIGVVPAEAAAKWKFSTSNGKKKANVNDTISLKKQELADMNLYRNGKQIKENNALYTVSWYSSDENIVYIDKKTGKMRADKFNKMTTDSATAKITAVIKNKTSGTSTKKSFTVKVTGNSKPIPTAAPTTIPTAASYPKAPLNQGDLTYNFHDMAVCFDDGVDYTINKNGSLAIQYNRQYSQIRLLLPESINLDECIGLTLKMNGNDKYIDVCFYREEILTNPSCFECFGRWGVHIDGPQNYYCLPPEAGVICGIGIVVGAEDSDYSGYKFTIDNVTFHMTSGSKISIPKSIAPDVTEDMTLLNTYGTVFENIGAMVTLDQLKSPAVLKEIKKQFNSVTMGYHIDYPFADPLTFISIEEAKQLGYYIPADYPDDIVPKFDFTTWDEVLKVCAENDIHFRAQASTCNGQIPKWFFSKGYQDSGAYVTPEEMNARNEFYIRTIMEHAYNSEYGHLVYSWDLINEYYRTLGTDWVEVYGPATLTPDNMKRLYEAAADVLVKHGIRDKVSLVLNEYLTYTIYGDQNAPNDLLAIADYINSDTKALDAIGMEGLIGTKNSTTSFKNALKKFLAAGYEVQITEMDVPLTENTEEQRANQTKIYNQVLRDVLALKKAGANISVLSFHTPAAVFSAPPEDSAFFLSLFGRPKDCYYAMLQAYVETINDPVYTPPQISANGDLTYTARDLDHLELIYVDEPTFTAIENDALEISFSHHYQSIRFGLPEGIDMSKCTGVTFKLKSDNSTFTLELLNENTLFNPFSLPLYSNCDIQADGILEYTLTPNITDSVHGIGLVIQYFDGTKPEHKAILDSVTFHMQQ